MRALISAQPQATVSQLTAQLFFRAFALGPCLGLGLPILALPDLALTCRRMPFQQAAALTLLPNYQHTNKQNASDDVEVAKPVAESDGDDGEHRRRKPRGEWSGH